MSAEMSTAERIAAQSAAIPEVIAAIPQKVVHELPDSDMNMNIPPHLIAQAAVAHAQPEPVSVGATETVQVSTKVVEGVTVDELVESGIPFEIAERLTPDMIAEIGRLRKNAYTRIWNNRRKGATKAEELQAHSAAVTNGREIQRAQAEKSIYDIPAIPQIVSTSEKIKSQKVREMENNTEKRIEAVENGMNDIRNLLTQLVGKQGTPQNFAATTHVASPTAPMPVTRLFTYVRKDNKIGANIAIEPLPANVTQWHNSALFTPGNIANLRAMYIKDPAAFGKNLEEAYATSLPYQFKKDK
jgi:hypothetical protein